MGDANRQGMGEGGVATMTPQPQDQEYIITREELERVEVACINEYGDWLGHTNDVLFETIRSRLAPAPETCKKYWNYRADSGHLYHLLYDLLGVMPTPETLGDALMQVRDRDTAIRKAERERVLDKYLDELQKEIGESMDYIDWDSVEAVYIRVRGEP